MRAGDHPPLAPAVFFLRYEPKNAAGTFGYFRRFIEKAEWL